MNEKQENLFDDITHALQQASGFSNLKDVTHFHKKINFTYLGLSTPQFSTSIKPFTSSIKSLPIQDAITLAAHFYKTHILEYASAATYILTIHKKLITPKYFDALDKMLDEFQSWGTTDDVCINVLQPVLLNHSKETLALLKKWNSSENPWKRRASVVIFTRKIGESGTYLKQVLQLCNNLLFDKDDLVLKGVGWALKDNMRADQKLIIKYVKDLRKKNVSSIITLYAIRDLDKNERNEILAIK